MYKLRFAQLCTVAAGVTLTALLGMSAARGALQKVSVLYAGSLVTPMEGPIKTALRERGIDFQGQPGGSKELANLIAAGIRSPDVFISVNPKLVTKLGDRVASSTTFAGTSLGVAWSPNSRFNNLFESVVARQTTLWLALARPGVKIGRTDPKLDPKGGLTLALMKDAASFYKMPDLSQRVLGAPDNPAQVLPEETLVGRLQSGQLDVGFFYSTETSDAKIPALALPPEIAPKAIYTVTILRAAPNADGADRFVAFFLGAEGQKLLKAHGLTLQPLTLTGAESSVPPNIQALLAKAK